MTGIRPPAPSPVPKTAPPPESKWMLERGGVSDRLETEGTRGEAEAKQPRGAGIPEIPEAVHRDPLAAGSTQPRFQLSPDKTSPDDHIQHRKAQADDSPSLAAKQVEIHVHNKVTRHDIPEGEISKKAYVGLPENKQIKVERSMTVEISNEVTRHDIPEGEISKKSYVGLPENEQIKVERSMTMEISNQVTRHDISEGEISKNSYVGLPENKQIKVERSMTMEISNQVQKAMENIGLISVWKTVAV